VKNIIVMTLKLLAITIVAGLLLGAVNYITKEPIAEQEIAAANAARSQCFPQASSFEESDVELPEEYGIINSVYTALDENGNDIGIVAGVVTKGFSAGLNLTIGIGADGKVAGAVVGTHEETPGLGANASEPYFIDQFKDVPFEPALVVVKVDPAADNEIKAISGATITSRAVTDAVNTVADFYKSVMGGAQ
jgi:electron transport complex protein RnfG